MKNYLKAVPFGVVFFSLCGASLPSHAPNIRVVGISNGQVVVVSSDGSSHNLTYAGDRKYRPVWSPDGSMIAYLESTPSSVALSRLVIMRVDGSVIAKALVHPVGDPSSNTDIRYIESLRWAGNKKIVLSGGINPSTVEYIEFRVGNPSATNDFMADGFQVDYSRDGNHSAVVAGSVHWALGDAPSPTLTIDGKPVASLTDHHVKFLSNPSWAPDNASVAIVIGAEDSQQANVFIRRSTGMETRVRLPSGTRHELLWDEDGNLYAIVDGLSPENPARAFWVKPAIGKLQSVEAKAIPEMSAAAVGKAAVQSMQAQGLQDVDIWSANAPESAKPDFARFFK
jgi:YD repeat-containing protein